MTLFGTPPHCCFANRFGGGQGRKCWVNTCFGHACSGRAQRSGLADAGGSDGCSDCSHTWARSSVWVAMLVPAVAAEATGDVEATALCWAEAMTKFPHEWLKLSFGTADSTLLCQPPSLPQPPGAGGCWGFSHPSVLPCSERWRHLCCSLAPTVFCAQHWAKAEPSACPGLLCVPEA